MNSKYRALSNSKVELSENSRGLVRRLAEIATDDFIPTRIVCNPRGVVEIKGNRKYVSFLDS